MPPWLTAVLSDDNIKAAGIFLAGLFMSFWKLILPAISTHVTKKFLKSDPGPVSPMPVPGPVQVIELPAPKPVLADASEAARIMVEWTIDEARRRVRELQDELALAQREKRQVEYQLEDAMRDNARTSLALSSANIEIARLDTELDSSRHEAMSEKARAAQAWRALAEYKREVSSGFQGSPSVTPLRPPKPR